MCFCNNFTSPVRKYYKQLQQIKCEIHRIHDAASVSPHSPEICSSTVAKKVSRHKISSKTKKLSLAAEKAFEMLGLNPFDSQILAALALCDESIVELATGEGKTLVAAIAACQKLDEYGQVHILTFNDYLAERDANWMRPLFEKLGYSVSFITQCSTIEERKRAYDADIVYAAAREIAFDVLRNFLAFSRDAYLNINTAFAIIDEADSVLIDEARMPLVVAGDVFSCDTVVDEKLFQCVRSMQVGTHFSLQQAEKEAFLEDAGFALIEKIILHHAVTDDDRWVLSSAISILKALHLIQNNVDYIVRNGKIVAVDEFTGRVAENRQWEPMVQAALERKEGLASNIKSEVINRITLQNFIRMYKGFAGMTGTAQTSSGEFLSFYGKAVISVPSNKPCIRIDKDYILFATRGEKYTYLEKVVLEAWRIGRPVLIGTADIEESEAVYAKLSPHIPNIAVLNAKNDKAEAEIISKAGRRCAVTISTNMAGRGVDIQLGENEDDHRALCELGGLLVLGLNCHDSRRIDNQLRGRAGRQGDPGESQFFVSIEDPLFHKCPLDSINRELQLPVFGKPATALVIHAQKRIEANTFYAKDNLSKYDYMLDRQRIAVTDLRNKVLFEEILFQTILGKKPTGKDLEVALQIELFSINEAWMNYLAYAESIKDTLPAMNSVGVEISYYYSNKLSMEFDTIQSNFEARAEELYDRYVAQDGFPISSLLMTPSAATAYILTDNIDRDNSIGATIGIGLAAPFAFMLRKLLKKTEKKQNGVDGISL